MTLKRLETASSRPGFWATLLLLLALMLAPTTSPANTLAEIYRMAVENDPQLGTAEAQFLSRREAVALNRAGLLPNINVGGSTSDNRRTILTPTPNDMGQAVLIPPENYNDHVWQATLRQPVLRLENWFRFQQAKNIRAEAIATFSAEQQALIVRVAESYFNILEQQSRLSASNAERSAVQRQLEQVQQRFDVGLVAITDVLESQAAFDSSTVSVIEAEGAQSTSFEPLLRLTGKPMRQIHNLADNFPVRHPDPQDEDAWVRAALKNNYQIAAARERLRSAERQLQIARSGYVPTLDAEVAWTHNVSGSRGFFGTDTKSDGRALTLNMNVPIYKGGQLSATKRQAMHNVTAAREALDLMQRETVEATRNLYTAVATDVARVRAGLRGMESSQSALDATRTGYEVGTRNIVDVLQAQQRLFLSQFQYASAKYKYVIDTLRLKQTVGVLNPDDLYDLNDFIDTNMAVSRTTTTTR